jgi:hypothetical protein
MQATSLDRATVIGQQGSTRKELVHSQNTTEIRITPRVLTDLNTANATGSTLPYTIPDPD